MLFLFLAAMFGLVLSENLIWMYFFWEVTSVISFLLIGYTRTEEAVNNSFRALWMNLVGGFGFAIAIAVAAATLGTAGGGCPDRSGDPCGVVGAGRAHKIRAAAVFFLAAGRDGRSDSVERAFT